MNLRNITYVMLFTPTHLSKVSGVSEHVNVEQLCEVPTAVRGVLLTEHVPDVGALLLHHRPLVRSGPGRTDLTNQVPQPLRGRHPRAGQKD